MKQAVKPNLFFIFTILRFFARIMSPLFFSQKTRLSIIMTLTLSLIGITNAAETPANKAVAIDSPSLAQPILNQITNDQKQLEKLRTTLIDKLRNTERNNSTDADKLLLWQSLAEQFIFNPEVLLDLRHKTHRGETLLQKNAVQEAHILLRPVATKYQQLVKEFDLIEQTIDAEKKSDLTRTDSKMYFKMRVRSELPAKVLKA